MNKQQKRGMLLLLAGLLLVGAALTIHMLQRQEDIMAGQTAQMLLQQLELSRVELPEWDIPAVPEETTPTVSQMPEKEYRGYHMIGSIRVPAVDVHLPVMSSWSEKLLKIAPCRYMGSLPEPGMIIMGHNYRSHFTPLHKAEVGDEVIFEDVEGKLYRFRIADIQILHRTEGEKLESEYPLTLFTCTPGGLERRILRCAYTEGS